MRDAVLEKWRRKEGVVAVIGLGYVGLPLALSFCGAGIKTFGIDCDSGKVRRLASGVSGIQHIADSAIVESLRQGFLVGEDYAVIADADAVIICVPTPLKATCEPDLHFVLESLDYALPYLRAGQVIALESTTYPGTSEEEIAPRLVSSGFGIGEDIFLVYSPEREDPGNSQFSTATIPKIIGGYSAACGEVGVAMYGCAIQQMVQVKNTRTAEMVKLLENIYRAVNIGLVNEMKQLTDKMDIDIYEVIKAAASKPFGFSAFYPGPGVGGHCIPVDPFYLTWKARAYGLHTRFIELAGEINKAQPGYVVEKVSCALNQQEKSVKGSAILIIGVSYKRNIGDLRESPALEIIRELRASGGVVDYSDPHVPLLGAVDCGTDLEHKVLSAPMLETFDAVVIVSDHDDFDYALIYEHARVIIDCRGRFSSKSGHESGHENRRDGGHIVRA